MKNSKNKAILPIISPISIVTILIVLTFFIVNLKPIHSESNIKEKEYYKISNNLYYTDDLINNKKYEDKEKILDYYKTISNYLDQKYPSLSFYISNFNYDTLDKEKNGIIFNLYQILDMAIIDKSQFSIDLEDGKVIEYDYNNADINNFVSNDLIENNKVNIDDVKKTALNLAKEHADEIFVSKSPFNVIKGEYNLRYNDENKLYYRIVLNNGSYIDIDAEKGKVINTYFSNGIVF